MTGTSAAQLKAGQMVLMAVAEAIRELGECPSGTLYANLMGRLSFNQYQSILDILTRAKLITVGDNHLIRWVGPKLQEVK